MAKLTSGARVLASITAAASVLFLGVACAPPPAGGGCTVPTAIYGGYPLIAPVSGWYSADTRTTGNVTVNADLGAPAGLGCNSAKLTTGANVQISGTYQDKAQLFSYAQFGTAFASIANVSYWSYRSSASLGTAANASLNIELYGTAGYGTCTVPAGAPGCYANLVYEPYNQSGGTSAIVNDTWQHWDATATTAGDGVWWTKQITSGPGSQSSPQPWAFFQARYTDATLGGYGFNLGSNNPNMVVGADGLTLGATTTDF